MKRKTFTEGQEVAVCYVFNKNLITVTKVTKIDQLGIHTSYHRREYGGYTWTATGLEPLDSDSVRVNRLHIRPVTDEDRDEIRRRGIAAAIKQINWDKLDLHTLIQVSLCIPSGTIGWRTP